MAEIKVENLFAHDISGSNLFSDSESFLEELGEENDQIVGGLGCMTASIIVISKPCTLTFDPTTPVISRTPVINPSIVFNR